MRLAWLGSVLLGQLCHVMLRPVETGQVSFVAPDALSRVENAELRLVMSGQFCCAQISSVPADMFRQARLVLEGPGLLSPLRLG